MAPRAPDRPPRRFLGTRDIAANVVLCDDLLERTSSSKPVILKQPATCWLSVAHPPPFQPEGERAAVSKVLEDDVARGALRRAH